MNWINVEVNFHIGFDLPQGLSDEEKKKIINICDSVVINKQSSVGWSVKKKESKYKEVEWAIPTPDIKIEKDMEKTYLAIIFNNIKRGKGEYYDDQNIESFLNNNLLAREFINDVRIEVGNLLYKIMDLRKASQRNVKSECIDCKHCFSCIANSKAHQDSDLITDKKFICSKCDFKVK